MFVYNMIVFLIGYKTSTTISSGLLDKLKFASLLLPNPKNNIDVYIRVYSFLNSGYFKLY